MLCPPDVNARPAPTQPPGIRLQARCGRDRVRGTDSAPRAHLAPIALPVPRARSSTKSGLALSGGHVEEADESHLVVRCARRAQDRAEVRVPARSVQVELVLVVLTRLGEDRAGIEDSLGGSRIRRREDFVEYRD